LGLRLLSAGAEGSEHDHKGQATGHESITSRQVVESGTKGNFKIQRTAGFWRLVNMTAFHWSFLLLLQSPDSASRIHYGLSIALSPDRASITGEAVLRLPADVWKGDSLILSMGEGGNRLRAIGAPTLDGREVPFRLDSTVMVLRRVSSPGVELRLRYQAVMDSQGRRQLGYDLLAPAVGSPGYPAVSGRSESSTRLSDFEATFTVPEGTAVVSSGTTVNATPVPGGRRIRERALGVDGFVFALAPGYLVRSHESNGFRVRALSPPADTLIWDRIAGDAVRAASWYASTYGFFPEHDLAVVPGSESSRGGFPMPRLFMIHRGDLSPPFTRWITAHELAHYFWGLHVLSSTEQLDWLMLGLGIWTDQLFLTRTSGISLDEQWRNPQADKSLQEFLTGRMAGYDGRLDLPEAEESSLDYDYNTYVRHAKGAVAVWLLATRLGTDRFIALQRGLLAEFDHRPLAPSEFASRLEAAGVDSAARLLRLWHRGDATIDYAVRAVREDRGTPGSYWIDVERTGTIPYPVTLEAVPVNGKPVRVVLSGEANYDSVRVALDGALSSVRLDPDGVLPMGSSANLDMQRVYLRALGEAGPAAPFIVLAREHLARDPDPWIAALLVERLFEQGQFAQIDSLRRSLPVVVGCRDRATCYGALQVARALVRQGQTDDARTLFSSISATMISMGLGNARRLSEARAEVRPNK